jgi:hypothetical protein
LYRVELKSREGEGKERGKGVERAVLEVNMYRKQEKTE